MAAGRAGSRVLSQRVHASEGAPNALIRYAPLAARLIVGGIFLLAAVPKIQSPGLFADAVRAYHLLPPSVVLPLALTLPWIEALVALYLLVGFLARPAGVAAAVMLLTFVYALLTSLITGNTAHSCGCFGPGQSNPVITLLSGGNAVGWWDVFRDLILAGLAMLVAFRGAGPLSVDALIARRAGVGDG